VDCCFELVGYGFDDVGVGEGVDCFGDVGFVGDDLLGV